MWNRRDFPGKKIPKHKVACETFVDPHARQPSSLAKITFKTFLLRRNVSTHLAHFDSEIQNILRDTHECCCKFSAKRFNHFMCESSHAAINFRATFICSSKSSFFFINVIVIISALRPISMVVANCALMLSNDVVSSRTLA